MPLERLSTGIIGLDEKMQGGLFKGSVTLVTGKAGTGKTSVSVSFLYEGAKNNERGIYITSEERIVDIKNDVLAMFGWNLESLEQKGLIKFISIKPSLPSKKVSGEDLAMYVRMYIIDLIDKIETAVKEFRSQRLVIDSLSLIEMFIEDKYLCRVAMIELLDSLREVGVTSVVTGTTSETSEELSGGGIIEFLVDGIIKLDFVPVAEEFKRTLNIRKMRRTDHSIFIHPFEVAKDGLRIIEIKPD